MKKIAIFGLAVILLSWITNTAHAQYFAKNSLAFDAGASKNSNRSSSAVKDVTANTKAGKSFVRKYENATNARWSRLQNGGLLVHFYVDGIQTKIFYNKKGNETGMVRYYSEDELPSDVRHQVKSTYYDFDIFLVIEVTVGNKTVYLVKIENKICTKTIRVTNGEMDVVEEIDNL